MEQKTDGPDQSERVIPISKAVVDAFAKGGRFFYAKTDGGSLYISDGHLHDL